MRAEKSIRVPLALLRASVAMTFAIAPWHIVVDQNGAHPEPAGAYAKDGHSGGGGNSGSGSSGSGGGHSGSGGDHSDSGGDHSGSGGGGHSGSGGGDDGDHSGSGRGGNDDDFGDDNDDRNEHVNRATGAKVEINGNNIEVVHPDGTKEEIENGRFERKNAQGRTIVERPATNADLARLRAFAG